MKLATLANGAPDGRLVLVSKDLSRAVAADDLAPTLQAALERWALVEPALRARAEALESGQAQDAFAFEANQALAPLPRAWQWLDGSAFPAHGALMDKVFGVSAGAPDRPLMYQGVSDRFIAPTADVPMRDPAHGIDFEGEFAVVVDRTPMGVTPAAALNHIRLIMLVNDWSLRTIAPIEMKTGFGWVQAKPPCSAGPVAVTPDELGEIWKDGRVQTNLMVTWNGQAFGAAHGGAMAYGFGELVAHAAYTRDLCAGTIIGSGTVSNETYREVGSSCIAERRGIEIVDQGAPKTEFMRFGDRIRMEVVDSQGRSVFGAIDQKVVQALIEGA